MKKFTCEITKSEQEETWPKIWVYDQAAVIQKEPSGPLLWLYSSDVGICSVGSEFKGRPLEDKWRELEPNEVITIRLEQP